MNNIYIFAGIIITLAAIYTISQILQKLYCKSSRKVYGVLAGDNNEHQTQTCHTDTLRPFESFRLNGKRIDPSKYILAKVEGECMHPRGIHSGNLVFIHKLSEDEKKNIKDGSILYIHCKEKGIDTYYLREYIKDSSKGNVIATRFYRNGNDPKESEPHHLLNEVVGIVHYCFE